MNNSPMSKAIKPLKVNTTELVVLKSYALGMSDLAIMRLPDVSRNKLISIRFKLFKKLDVSNVYSAVNKAMYTGILNKKNFIDESLKEQTLKFIELSFNRIELFQGNTEQMKWEWYKILLEYTGFLSNKIKEIKKIPPKRD